MPLIGWMDIILGFVTLLRPVELFSAWMVVWAFSTALVRPVSAGMARTLSPMSDNALWGFVERASNWICPLALLTIQKGAGYSPKELIPGTSAPLAKLDAYANLPGTPLATFYLYMAAAFTAVWILVPILKSRDGGEKAKGN